MTDKSIGVESFNLSAFPVDLANFFIHIYLQQGKDKQELLTALSQYPAFMETVAVVWISSDFVLKNCVKAMDVILDLFNSQDILSEYSFQTHRKKLQAEIAAVQTELEFNRVLRRFRQREMLRIAWRDIAGWADVNETLQDLSNLADSCLQEGYDFYYQHLVSLFGMPVDEQGVAQHLLIFALGKLGARELNFSSDIDLIFAMTSQGQTLGAKVIISNEKFFLRLAQALIKCLNEITHDGFVFRVDMRLRPYGSAGALVMSLAAMEAYYQEQGRDWERYALLKARIVNTDNFPAAVFQATDMLKRFVYRRYVDYGVISALRDLKKLLEGDAKRKGIEQDIKRGAGGIRELEFIVQSIQLVRGGKEPYLQTTSFLSALRRFEKGKCLQSQVIESLESAWFFLRKLENLLQMFDDRQTQRLPIDDFSRSRIALAAGFSNWHDLTLELNRHLHVVKKHFAAMVRDPAIQHQTDPKKENTLLGLRTVWMELASGAENIAYLNEVGFLNNAQEIHNILKMLQASTQNTTLSSLAKKRLDALIPILMMEIINTANPVTTLERVCLLINAIVRRSAYLALLLENNSALTLLVRLFSASYYIAREVTNYPLLLDELLSLEWAYAKADTQLEDLQKRLLLIADNAPEERFSCVCQFKHARVLRAMATDLLEKPVVWQTCAELSAIALAVLSEIRAIAMDQLMAKFELLTDPTAQGFEFGIVAYGRLGSGELGYGSDLDLVFLFSADENVFEKKQGTMLAQEFAVRLAQRIIHLLSIQTPFGMLYELDLRLRPSGTVGSIVTSLDAFHEYQQNKAWVWEHQALVKASVVDGSSHFCQQFEQIRANIIQKKREKAVLQKNIRDMRQKMVVNLEHSGKDFDPKTMLGGITDIEFMVQYAVLLLADQYPRLAMVKQTYPLIQRLGELGFFTGPEVDLLKNALEHYYGLLQKLSLQGEKSQGLAADVDRESQYVRQIWDRIFS